MYIFLALVVLYVLQFLFSSLVAFKYLPIASLFVVLIFVYKKWILEPRVRLYFGFLPRIGIPVLMMLLAAGLAFTTAGTFEQQIGLSVLGLVSLCLSLLYSLWRANVNIENLSVISMIKNWKAERRECNKTELGNNGKLIKQSLNFDELRRLLVLGEADMGSAIIDCGNTKIEVTIDNEFKILSLRLNGTIQDQDRIRLRDYLH